MRGAASPRPVRLLRRPRTRPAGQRRVGWLPGRHARGRPAGRRYRRGEPGSGRSPTCSAVSSSSPSTTSASSATPSSELVPISRTATWPPRSWARRSRSASCRACTKRCGAIGSTPPTSAAASLLDAQPLRRADRRAGRGRPEGRSPSRAVPALPGVERGLARQATPPPEAHVVANVQRVPDSQHDLAALRAAGRPVHVVRRRRGGRRRRPGRAEAAGGAGRAAARAWAGRVPRPHRRRRLGRRPPTGPRSRCGATSPTCAPRWVTWRAGLAGRGLRRRGRCRRRRHPSLRAVRRARRGPRTRRPAPRCRR